LELGGWGYGWIAGPVLAVDVSIIVDLVSNLGSMGFILYLVHRTTTHTIPRLARENHDVEKCQREDFLRAQEQTRADFREALTEQREAFQREMAREREIHGAHVERLLEEIRRSRVPA
jgi:hypothetical protein